MVTSDPEHPPPLPLRQLVEVTEWIAHTLNSETTKKLPLTVDTKHSNLEKVEALQAVTSKISSMYLVFQVRLDKARLVPPNLP